MPITFTASRQTRRIDGFASDNFPPPSFRQDQQTPIGGGLPSHSTVVFPGPTTQSRFLLGPNQPSRPFPSPASLPFQGPPRDVSQFSPPVTPQRPPQYPVTPSPKNYFSSPLQQSPPPRPPPFVQARPYTHNNPSVPPFEATSTGFRHFDPPQQKPDSSFDEGRLSVVPPRPNVDVTPRRPPSLPSRPDVDIAPRRLPNLPPRPDVDVAPGRLPNLPPRPDVDVAPQRLPNLPPRPDVDVAPQRLPNLPPRPDVDVAPGRLPNLPPRPDVDVAPGRLPNLPPRPDVDVAPQRLPNLPPRPDVDVAPQRLPNLPPRPDVDVAPGRLPNLPPRPETAITSQRGQPNLQPSPHVKREPASASRPFSAPVPSVALPTPGQSFRNLRQPVNTVAVPSQPVLPAGSPIGAVVSPFPFGETHDAPRRPLRPPTSTLPEVRTARAPVEPPPRPQAIPHLRPQPIPFPRQHPEEREAPPQEDTPRQPHTKRGSRARGEPFDEPGSPAPRSRAQRLPVGPPGPSPQPVRTPPPTAQPPHQKKSTPASDTG
ncbi:hypothetical protein BIW11_14339 [Tropilaelaps mercedesae]|uniref:Uncharacterized protein n=1 Tax=Tropilaelaps mercedesae TaxID=418985 RepID=A0A1V9WY73_9ACAR|nr:hypothetical protein BIW11_14339 [Tropilaelaps mercedesae]